MELLDDHAGIPLLIDTVSNAGIPLLSTRTPNWVRTPEGDRALP
jgi:hypothetical protein